MYWQRDSMDRVMEEYQRLYEQCGFDYEERNKMLRMPLWDYLERLAAMKAAEKRNE